jgi:hypothetical protein
MKHPMEGENKEQKERTHNQVKKTPQSNGQVKGVRKFSHVPNPLCDKRHVRKREGKYSKNNI